MRTTIAVAVATGLALFVFTPKVANAYYDAASGTALVGTADQTGLQEDAQVDSGQTQANQDEMDAGQNPEPTDQTGAQVDEPTDQSGEQGDQQVDRSDDQQS
jgi:hypothetical protein